MSLRAGISLSHLCVGHLELPLDVADPGLPADQGDRHVAEADGPVPGGGELVPRPVLNSDSLMTACMTAVTAYLPRVLRVGEHHHRGHVVLHNHPPEVQRRLLESQVRSSVSSVQGLSNGLP